jgi:competence protein ComEC
MLNILDLLHLRRSNHTYHWDKFYIVLIAILLFAFAMVHAYLWILFVVYIWVFKKQMHLGLLLVVCGLFLIRFCVWHDFMPKQLSHQEVLIVAIEQTPYHDRLTLKHKQYLIHANVTPERFVLGQRLIIDAEIIAYRKKTTPFGFDAFAYYRSSNVIGYTKHLQVEHTIEKNDTRDFRHVFLSWVDGFEHGEYIKKLIFNIDEMPKDTKMLYRHTGVWFLLGISGIHMYVVISLLGKVMFYLNVKPKHQTLVLCLIYLLMLYLSSGAWVIYRLFLFFMLTELVSYFKLMMPRFEKTLIVFIVLLFVFPFLIYHIGVIISLVLLLVLSLFHIRLLSYHPLPAMFYRGVIISIIIMFFTSSFRPLNIVMMPVLIFIFSWIIFPMMLISLILPYLDTFVYNIILMFEKMLEQIESKMFIIELPQYPIFISLILIYMLVKLLHQKNSRLQIQYGLMIVLLMITPLIRGHLIKSEVIFLDVEQGDSTIIRHDGCLIVIDAYQHVTKTLKGYGITTIDYLILSHQHADHTKESEVLLEAFHVKHLVLNPYDDYQISHPQTLYAKQGDIIRCNGLTLNVLGPIRNHQSSNNNSLVILFHIHGMKFLMTGDIEIEAEKDLVDIYKNNLKSDVIKVPHHGSKTSSHEAFLMMVSPTYAIISLKEQNRHGFPHIEVINRYLQQGISIYQTDVKGSIVYQVILKREKWKFYMPY